MFSTRLLSRELPWLAGMLIALNLICGASAQMVASNDRVRIEARLSTDADRQDVKKSRADTVTQKNSLKIQLSGKARPGETRIVKWTAYGRNVKTNDLKVIESGQAKLSLDRSGTQILTTPVFTSTYTPDHAVTSKGSGGGTAKGGKGGRGNRLPQAKRVEGEGTKFAGYFVRVLDGQTVVGESADPVGIGAD